MKVIVAGATGFVGSAILEECIKNDRITQALVLTRKPLSAAVAGHAKVVQIILEDFSSYPPEILKQLAGAEGCLWAIGGRVPQFPDVETARRVGVKYTLAAGNAFVSELAPQLVEGKKFRFVYCSAMLAEWDQTKPLYFMQETRRIKGAAEKGLCDIADANPDTFEVWCARPSGILSTDAGILSKWTGKLYNAIGADHIAKALVTIALDGYPERIIENDKLLLL